VIRRSLFFVSLLAVAWLAIAVPLVADSDQPVGEGTAALWPAVLAWLVPIGLGMLACGAVPPDRVAAVIRSGWLALGLSAVVYWLIGFAFQFGGVGFAYDHPELVGLAREWTWAPLEASWGSDWGVIGLEGYLLRGPAATPAALYLFLTQLPWITTAVAIPLWSLQGRTRPVVLFLSGLLQATLYAVIGNWIWGGGWLANLGLNLGLGHGYVDYAGIGPVHLAGAASALAGMLAFGVRSYVGRPVVGKQLALPGLPEKDSYVPMPALHLPVLATFGAWLAAVGWLGWASSTPMQVLEQVGARTAPSVPWAGTWINLWLAAAGGAVVALAFGWLTTGEGNALMTARGVLGALIAVGPGVPFLPPWAALVVGAGAGLLVPFVQYAIEHLLRFDDPTSAVATHGVPALWGLLAVGLFAAGQAGAGWNRVGIEDYLGVQGQGVSGYLVAIGQVSDWPGQFQAQAMGIMAIGIAAFVLPWLLFAGVQGLTRAWEGEYTLRLPARRQQPVWPFSRKRHPWWSGRRWPRIRIVRAASTMPLHPPVEATAADAPSIWHDRRDAVLSAIRRWAARVQEATQITWRRLVEKKTRMEDRSDSERADAMDTVAQETNTGETLVPERDAANSGNPPVTQNESGGAGSEQANGAPERSPREDDVQARSEGGV
jgi:Amt family ammonium transporter